MKFFPMKDLLLRAAEKGYAVPSFLAKIHQLVEIPLVLHGGSGTPDEDIKKAISLVIAKVNVASEFVRAIRESLRAQWGANQNLWVPAALIEARKDMEKVVEKWIVRVGAAGRA